MNRIKALIKKPGKRFYVFLVCLLIATFFWVLNALTKEYSLTISVPVEYAGVPDEKVIVNTPPKAVSFRVRGEGFNLLGVSKKNEFEPVTVDLRNYATFGDDEVERKVVDAGSIRNLVNDELGDYLDIDQLSADSIQILIEERMAKKVPVELDLNVTVNEQYTFQSDPFSSPDSVVAKGPKSEVMELSNVFTKRLELEDLETSVNEDLPIVGPSGKIKFDPANVKVTVPVEQLTQGSTKVKIETINLPDSLTLSTYPRVVKVNFKTGLSHFDSIDEKQFKAQVDYSSVLKNQPPKLYVNVTSKNDHVKVISYSPENVEYIIRSR
jgi:YbbR domain-containing protein